MESFEILEAAWNQEIDFIRNNSKARAWHSGAGRHNTFGSNKLADGRTVICEVILGKQLRVSIPATEQLRPDYNREHSASFTRNLPHDLQQLMKGTRV